MKIVSHYECSKCSRVIINLLASSATFGPIGIEIARPLNASHGDDDGRRPALNACMLPKSLDAVMLIIPSPAKHHPMLQSPKSSVSAAKPLGCRMSAGYYMVAHETWQALGAW